MAVAIRAASALLLMLGAGCGRPAVPDPDEAVRRFAQAARQGDAETIHRMLTRQSQREHGREGTRRLVLESRAELERLGRAIGAGRTEVATRAALRYADGETADLVVEQGQFRISAAAGLPSAAQTPAQALAELRQALARRSYSGLTRVLSSGTRSALENDLRSLVTGLEHPETLEIKVSADRAEVTVPGGHLVRLKKEAGLWKVEDFD
jgi:TPR repeat protein